MTAAALAPAEPSGTSTAPSRSASRCTNSGGRDLLTSRRSGSATGWGAIGRAVLSSRSCAGRATVPAVSSPRSQRATCTAQSVRPASPNSRVPSSGSTIHTRLADSRAGSSRPSSESTASSGRSRASSPARNSCDWRSPAAERSASSRRPASVARSRASRSSSDIIGAGSIQWLSPATGSVRAGSVQYGRACLPQNLQVEDKRPVLHIAQIEPDRLLPGQVGAAVDLPQPGDARLDYQPAPDVVAVPCSLVRQRGPRADQRHVPAHDIDQLRQLVHRPAAEPGTNGRYPRVVADLEKHSVV